jgi:hypothetical protein
MIEISSLIDFRNGLGSSSEPLSTMMISRFGYVQQSFIDLRKSPVIAVVFQVNVTTEIKGNEL